MSLRFLDSFDDRSTAQLISKYNGGGAGMVIGAYGRNGTQGLHCTNDAHVDKTFDEQTEWIVGFALNMDVLSQDTAIRFISPTSEAQCYVRFESSGAMTLWNGNTVTLLGTTSSGLQVGVWTYVEISVLIGNTGSARIRFDGVDVLTLVGVDTMKSTVSSTVNSFEFFDGIEGNIDDLYICDTNGSRNNAFLGDIRIECLFPDAAGNYAEWTPSAGSNYQNVDDPASPGPDGDTTYNETDVPGERDSFTFPSLTTSSAVVAGVAFNMYMRKTEAGARGVKSFIRADSADYDHALTESVQDAYSMEQQVSEVNPADSNPFSVADINALEAGYKLES